LVQRSKVIFALEQVMKAPEGEQRCSSILSLTSALHGSGWSMPHAATLQTTQRAGTHYIGDWWAQNRSGRVQKFSPPTGIQSLDRPARSESLIPTELSRPTIWCTLKTNCCQWAQK